MNWRPWRNCSSSPHRSSPSESVSDSSVSETSASMRKFSSSCNRSRFERKMSPPSRPATKPFRLWSDFSPSMPFLHRIRLPLIDILPSLYCFKHVRLLLEKNDSKTCEVSSMNSFSHPNFVLHFLQLTSRTFSRHKCNIILKEFYRKRTIFLPAVAPRRSASFWW